GGRGGGGGGGWGGGGGGGGGGGAPRLGNSARHEGDLGAGIVRAIDVGLDVLVGARPGERDRGGPQREPGGELLLVDVEDQEVERERLVGALADGRDGRANALAVHVVTAHRAEPARVRHGRDQLG